MLIETKMSFLFSSNTYNFLSFTSFNILQNESSYFLSETEKKIKKIIIFFYFIIFFWCVERKTHLLFCFIYKTTPYFSSSFSISFYSFGAQNKKLIFPSNALEKFSFILLSSISFLILGKIISSHFILSSILLSSHLFCQVISYCIFKYNENNEFIEE